MHKGLVELIVIPHTDFLRVITTQAAWKNTANPAIGGIDIILVSDNDPPEAGDPAKRALDCIFPPVAIPESVLLSNYVPMVVSMSNEKVDPSLSQALSSWIAVECLISDHSPGSGPGSARASIGDSDLSKCLDPGA